MCLQNRCLTNRAKAKLTVCINLVGRPSIYLCLQTKCLWPILPLSLLATVERLCITPPCYVVKQITLYGSTSSWSCEVSSGPWGRLGRIIMATAPPRSCFRNYLNVSHQERSSEPKFHNIFFCETPQFIFSPPSDPIFLTYPTRICRNLVTGIKKNHNKCTEIADLIADGLVCTYVGQKEASVLNWGSFITS